MAGFNREDVRKDVSETGMNVRDMPVYRVHISLRMPTPIAVKQFPITANLRQDEDRAKQDARKTGRLIQAAPNGINVVVKNHDKKEEEKEPERKLAKAQVVESTDAVTLMNTVYLIGGNFILIGTDFSVTDNGRTTYIKLRFVKKGMKLPESKPAKDPDGLRRQKFFHSHNREIWEEYVKFAKSMVVSVQVAKNEARVMPDNAIIQIDAAHARPLDKDWLPTSRLEINDHKAFLAKI